MTNKWNRVPYSPMEEEIGLQLSKELKLAPVIGKLLVRRGISTPEEANNFFHPSLDNLLDPFLMKDMDKAVARLNRALGRKERILIYGDYDVDGTTAVTLVYKYLRTTGCSEKQLDFYIPDRYDEGYGVSKRGIDYAHERNVKLIIVLDCGIKAIEEIAYAQSLGIDFIVCDHHNPGEELPAAVAVLDPKREDDTYPNEDLSGCGVGFKLMQAFAMDNGFSQSKLFRLLDLLAVSIASDIVSVMGENRILAYYGLKQLNSNPSTGLKGIIKTCGLEEKQIDMSDIVYKIGPRINASGRMMKGREAVELLLSRSVESAARRSKNVDQYNEQRREVDKVITEEAIALIENSDMVEGNKIIVLYQPDWHKGVIGIVASRITELYARPTIILTGVGNQISGSARSIGGFDVYKVLEENKDLLQNFGGHTFAAGLTIIPGKLHEFRTRIATYATLKPEETPQHILNVDARITLREVNRKLYNNICRMGPFGTNNPKPLFLIEGVLDSGSSRRVGHNEEHLKLDLCDSSRRVHITNAIAFGQAASASFVKDNKPFSIVFQLEENLFNGQSSLQMHIKDIKQDVKKQSSSSSKA